MVSNWAWAIAAWATGEMSSRSMKRQRSSSSGRTRFAGGPTYSARLGSTPPIQLGPPRGPPGNLVERRHHRDLAMDRLDRSDRERPIIRGGRQGTLHRPHRPDDLPGSV